VNDIFIITSYFPPEIGAASNRIFHLADGLQRRNFKVTVITPLPNYPTGKIFEGYRAKFKTSTTENNLTIHRLWIYASNSKNKIKRLITMLSYSFSLIWFFIWHNIPKTVIVQSPPLLVAFTYILFLRSKKRKIILNVSDLWPLAGLELGVFRKNFSYKILEKIERFNYKNSNMILGQSEEILTHVKSINPKIETFLYRNFPNFKLPDLEQSGASDRKIKLVYAGLLGVAQGIYKLCNELDYSNIEFHIYGSGSEQEMIELFVKNNPNLPIDYHGEIPREALHKELLKYDLTIIPLLNRIYGSVPSKIFEYAHLGLPIIYFGGGEGENIVIENELGWVVEVGNYLELNNIISGLNKETFTLELKQKIFETAIRKFNFEQQIDLLINRLYLHP